VQNKAVEHGHAMDALRQKYKARLVERRAELRGLAEKMKAAPQEARALLEELSAIAHKLAGSGETYGFPALSEAARRVEDSVAAASQLGAEEGAALCGDLIDACAHAEETQEEVENLADDELAWLEDARAEEALLTRHVLLTVDDDADMRELVQAIFEEDAEVLSAGNAEEARKVVAERKPDVILLDEKMPGMSGVAFLEELAAVSSDKQPYVIMLTADRESASVMRALAAGAVDYLVKPVPPEKLKQRVFSLLENAQTSILVADDDPALRDLLASKFRATGVKVNTARNGIEALEEAAREKYALIILDRMMPGMDGLAVLKKLRQTYGRKMPPVIFLTARRNEQDVLEGLSEGALDYVVKPFVPDEVVLRAKRIIEQNRQKKGA